MKENACARARIKLNAKNTEIGKVIILTLLGSV